MVATTLASPPSSLAKGDRVTTKHIRGSSLLLAGRLIAVGLNLAVQVLVVRYLTKSDYGAFAYALSIVSLCSSMSLLGLNKALARFVPIYEEQRDYNRMFGTIILIVATILGLGLSIVSLTFGFQGVIARSLITNPLSVQLLLILIILSPVHAFDNLLVTMLAIFATPRAIFFRRHIVGPGLKLAAVAAVILAGSNVHFLACAYTVAGVLGVAIYTVLLLRVLRNQGLLQHFNPQALKLPARQVFVFSTSLLSTDLAHMATKSFGILVLGYFYSSSRVAEFTAVLPVAAFTMVVLQSFKFLFMPMAARMFARGDWTAINHLYWQTAIWITILTFPLFALFISFAHPVTVLLFGERYADAGVILALLSIGYYFNAALGFNSLTLKVFGKVRYIVTIDILATILALILTLLLIPPYGPVGAALASCITLIIHNLLNQGGLLFGTGIKLLEPVYLKVYSTALIAILALVLVQLTGSPPLYMGLALTALLFVVLIRLNRNRLDLSQAFPELRRLRTLRYILGI